MQRIEGKSKEQIGQYLSRYFHFETWMLQSMIRSMVTTDSPKALELREDDRVGLICCEGGYIVHALESDISLEGYSFTGVDALKQIAEYGVVKFRELKCSQIQEKTLHMLPEELFHSSLMGKDESMGKMISLVENHLDAGMGVIVDEKSHDVFHNLHTDNYSLLTDELLNYCRELMKNLNNDHYQPVDNVELQIDKKLIKKILVKNFKDSLVLIFLKSSEVPEDLLVPFSNLS